MFWGSAMGFFQGMTKLGEWYGRDRAINNIDARAVLHRDNTNLSERTPGQRPNKGKAMRPSLQHHASGRTRPTKPTNPEIFGEANHEKTASP
jgi:hypothetical protein